jgi:hypothetical protein
MPSNNHPKPKQHQPQPPEPEALNPEDFEVPETVELQPRRKPAGKPSVKNRVAKPKIGAVAKVKPTFGTVRGVYN